ncbi:hypothetical protein D3C78_1369370 [compost metagenome]
MTLRKDSFLAANRRRRHDTRESLQKCSFLKAAMKGWAQACKSAGILFRIVRLVASPERMPALLQEFGVIREFT